jgi:ketol-acid reductoisomerase
MHELKLIVDLMYQGGMTYMWYSVSDTAEDGGYLGGERLITEETKGEMDKMLKEIQNGSYAKNWIEENVKGRPWFNERRKQERGHMIEKVGAQLREMMPFIKPKRLQDYDPGG